MAGDTVSRAMQPERNAHSEQECEQPTQRRRIHWFCWQPTPYNDHLFSSIAKERSTDLEVHYRNSVVGSHPWRSALAQGYRSRVYRLLLGVDWRSLSLPFKDRSALFVVGGWDHPTTLLLLSLLRILRFPYAVWTDTPNLARQRRTFAGALRRVWLRWIFRGARRTLGTGRPAVEALVAMGADPARTVNFPYWVDLQAYRRVPHGSRSTATIRFLSSGRVHNAVKGHDIAVRALALAAQRSTRPFEYAIAGTGPDTQRLEDLIASSGLKDRVKVIGWVEPDELRELYMRCDVLIHPSPVHEPFGVAVVEAMAAGLTVLASDVTGAARDRLVHGTNGFVHRAGDVEQLAEHILFVVEHPEDIAAMGERARNTAEEWPVTRGIATIHDMFGRP